MEVYDVLGQLVVGKTILLAKGNNLIPIDVSDFAEGIYVLNVKTIPLTDIRGGTISENQKFIKHKL